MAAMRTHEENQFQSQFLDKARSQEQAEKWRLYRINGDRLKGQSGNLKLNLYGITSDKDQSKWIACY